MVATPVLKAGYPGILKLFLDRLEPTALETVIAVPVVLTASSAHGALADLQLRVVLQAVGALLPVPSSCSRNTTSTTFRSTSTRGRPASERRFALSSGRCTQAGERPMSAERADEQEAQLAHVTDEVFRSVFATMRPAWSWSPPRVVGDRRVHRDVADLGVAGPAHGVLAVARSASAWPTVARSRRLGVHLLADDQDGLATTFATSGINRFETCAGIPDRRASRSSRTALPSSSATSIATSPPVTTCSCSARVTQAHVARVGSPLIYHDGGYATVGPAPLDSVQTPPLRRTPR